MAPHIVLSAGEASGDLHGARLAAELKALVPGVRLSGVGGPAMAAAGVELLFRSEDLAMVGFSELPSKLGTVLAALRGVKRHMRQERPQLFIPIDFPDFNFRLMKAAPRLGLKVLYYICPQVWAWRRGRAKYMARFVDRLAVTFPFEPDFLAQIAPELKTTFVGHPLLDDVAAEPVDDRPLPVPQDRPLVGILPGSRTGEVERILPLLLEAAKLMRQKEPRLHFVLPVAPGLSSQQLGPYLQNGPEGLTVLAGRAGQVMAQSRVCLVASGTATLQTALAGTPMVVVYKIGSLNYALARLMIKVEHIAMPNLIAGRRLVPELIQGQATPRAVAEEALELLAEGPRRRDTVAGLADVRRAMGGPGASRRVAELARELITTE